MSLEYGVVIGQYESYTTNQGQWMPVDLDINANSAQYQAAVDVNEPNGRFQSQVFTRLDLSVLSNVSALPDGYHRLQSNPPLVQSTTPAARFCRGRWGVLR
jgi:hypothetical protein